MAEPRRLATSFHGVDVFASEHAERGHPRLIPDPRVGGLLIQLGDWSNPKPRRKPAPHEVVLVIHPDDLGQLKRLINLPATRAGRKS